MSSLPGYLTQAIAQRTAAKTRIDALMMMVEAACMEGDTVSEAAAVKALHNAVDAWVGRTHDYTTGMAAHLRGGQ